MSGRSPVVFLVDVDDTLLENGRIQNDLREHLEREFGAACRDRYWKILYALFEELGYRDYLGALQRYRIVRASDGQSFVGYVLLPGGFRPLPSRPRNQ